MLLYLLRHAEAQAISTAENDFKRKLTPFGVDTLRNSKERILDTIEDSAEIHVSPYVRTKQTADILLEETPGREYVLQKILGAENYEQGSIFQYYKSYDKEKLLVVSHEPQIRSLLEDILGSQKVPSIYTASFHCVFWDQKNFARLLFSIPAKYLQGGKR